MWKLIIKRFKKFSLIDYLIVLVIILTGIFFVSKYVKKTAYVYMDLSNLSEGGLPSEYWNTTDIGVGDKSYNSFGKVVAEIVDFKRQVWSSGTRYNVDMTVKVKATYDNKQKQYLVDGSPMLVGNRVKFSFGSKLFEGSIRNVYENKEDRMKGYKKARAEIIVRLRTYEQEHLNKLRDFKLMDSSGILMVQVKNIIITPSEVYSILSNERKYFEGYDESMKDAILVIDLPEIWCKNDICYYNHYQTFAVGSQFWSDNGDVWFGISSTIIDRKVVYE